MPRLSSRLQKASARLDTTVQRALKLSRRRTVLLDTTVLLEVLSLLPALLEPTPMRSTTTSFRTAQLALKASTVKEEQTQAQLMSVNRATTVQLAQSLSMRTYVALVTFVLLISFRRVPVL